MIFFFKEQEKGKAKQEYEKIDFELLKCIAILELYLKEKWIEPIPKSTLPFSLLYHQTMSYLFGVGAVAPKELAKQILTLTPFRQIEKEDYRKLLKYWLEKEELEKDEEGNLMIGRQGERKVNNFQFFSVFTTPEEYVVRNGSTEIGTVETPYPIGQKFSLAGLNWEVVDIQEEKKIIIVKKIAGISKIAWTESGEFFVHTKVMKKIKEILEQEEEYRYLDHTSLEKLKEARELAKESLLLEKKVLPVVEGSYVIFPWLGTKEMIALSYCLKQEGYTNRIYSIAGNPICIEVMTKKTRDEIQETIQQLKTKCIQKENFKLPDKIQKIGKYNYLIPEELLKKQYREDCIEVENMQQNL